MPFVYYNGQLVAEEQVFLSPNNRAFRYADGFFETLKVNNGVVALKNFHFERLYSTLEVLNFKSHYLPDFPTFTDQIVELVCKNHSSNCSRVRITIFASDGLLYDVDDRVANYLIQTYPLKESSYPLNKVGLSIDFFKDALKPCDSYSHLKSNNFLPYVMAAIWAKKNDVDDVLLLNQRSTIADSTIANLFIIKDGVIKTPPLSDGPVAGVMRSYLVSCFTKNDVAFVEASLTIDDVMQASEVFLTNAIFGIKWVAKFGDNQYSCSMVKEIQDKFLNKLPI